MVSLGLCFEGSGKPAILSTTAHQAKSHSKSWANTQRPTPDRCERSSSSQIARLTPHKVCQTFQSGNKSTTLIQYVNRNINSNCRNRARKKTKKMVKSPISTQNGAKTCDFAPKNVY